MKKTKKREIAECVIKVLHEINDSQKWVHPSRQTVTIHRAKMEDGTFANAKVRETVYKFNELDIQGIVSQVYGYVDMKYLRRIFYAIWIMGEGLLPSHVSPEFPNIRANWSYEHSLWDYEDTTWRIRRLFTPNPTEDWVFEMVIKEGMEREN